jgi:hypothetical protein
MTSGELRMPEFLIIGAQKSASSSVFYWLGDHPDVVLATTKEPHFFSVEERWERGTEWYASLFPERPPDALSGEASTSYTDPTRAALAAGRIQSLVPRARLVCVLRDPVERARSHYRHRVQRGRESRPFRDAATPDSPYVQRGRYGEGLAPYLERFPREQLCVVRTEDLGDGDGPAWTRILEHLGLASAPVKGQARHNITEVKGQFSAPALVLFKRGWLRRGEALPKPVRRAGRRLLLRDDDRYRDLLASSAEPISDDSAAVLDESLARLRALVGPDVPTWS